MVLTVCPVIIENDATFDCVAIMSDTIVVDLYCFTVVQYQWYLVFSKQVSTDSYKLYQGDQMICWFSIDIWCVTDW